MSMEHVKLQGELILWKSGLETWILNFGELVSSYISQKHPHTGKKLAPQINEKIQQLIKRCAGEWWLSTLDSLRGYRHIKPKNVSKNPELGHGKYARVYAHGKNCAVKVIKHFKYGGISKPLDGSSEARILKHLKEQILFPRLTPNVIMLYEYIPGKKEDYLVLERMNGTFWDLLQLASSAQREQPVLLQGIILQVIFSLAIIQQKLPGFRHNDIKVDNILLDPASHAPFTLVLGDRAWKIPAKVPMIKIADFDFANIPQIKQNPKVKSSYSRSFGCSPQKCDVYDVHLFLNSMYPYRKQFDPVTQKWLLKHLPTSVRGSENKALHYARLKKPEEFSNKLETPVELLKSNLFDKFSVKKVAGPWWGKSSK